MNENVKLNESPRIKAGTPGTGSAVKTGAGYRNAPHAFAAHREPAGSVLLEIEQNYTGRRQWFRFTRAEWAQLTEPRPSEPVSDDEDEDPGPDLDNDGFVGYGRGSYYAQIFGRDLTGPYGFPTSEIAIYELARAMAENGEFPAAWFEGEHGPSDRPIDVEVRRFHDAGGSQLLPLDGMQYADGDLIEERANPGEVYRVEHDYGTLGVVTHADGDESVRWYVRPEHRDRWHRIEDNTQ